MEEEHIDPDALSELLALGHEQAGVEFKGSRPRTDGLFLAKVARAMMGMANRRGGGVVVLGVEDSGGILKPVGLSPDYLRTWTRDALADALAAYCEPSLDFTVAHVLREGLTFVSLRVSEFLDAPVICRRGFNHRDTTVLREGGCYVRPRKKPETSELATYVDMRDLLDLALEKALRRFLSTAAAGGAIVGGPLRPSDEQRFRHQRADLGVR